ncbi:MAG: hypothetical protein LBM13_03825 [Candidatus Ancillula sp.]|jgi:hypothetical protein|nr:hypothetical protein [Candidatus Ancillula sp.]
MTKECEDKVSEMWKIACECRTANPPLWEVEKYFMSQLQKFKQLGQDLYNQGCIDSTKRRVVL